MRKLLSLALLAALTACGGMTTIPSTTPVKANAYVLANGDSYRISPGDELDVRFLLNPELDSQVVVRPDGKVSLPLVRDVAADGLTPTGLAKVLEQAYAKEVRNPQVTVAPRSFTRQRVFIGGEVGRPGPYALPPGGSLLQTLMMAEGLRDSAKLEEIVIVRYLGDDRRDIFTVDFTSLFDGGNGASDIKLMPMDVVFVPRSGIANAGLWVRQHVRDLLPIAPSVGYVGGGT